MKLANLLAHAQQTELKRLGAAPRCRMHVPAFRDERKSITQNLAQSLRIVSYDRQAAALLGTVERKCGDNRMATRTQAAPQPVNIGGAIIRIDKEMKYGAIMPKVIASAWRPRRHISCDPFDLIAGRLKVPPGPVQCRFGQIKHGDVKKPLLISRAAKRDVPPPISITEEPLWTPAMSQSSNEIDGSS